MKPETAFAAVNLVAFLAWVVLALSPWLGRAGRVITGCAVPALLAAAYVVVIAVNWRGSPGGFSTLAQVLLLFGNPWLLLAGWMHYLAFDLLVGNREVADAKRRGIPHLMVLPCLVLTFLFGPAGWLAYQGLRAARRARSTPAAEASGGPIA